MATSNKARAEDQSDAASDAAASNTPPAAPEVVSPSGHSIVQLADPFLDSFDPSDPDLPIVTRAGVQVTAAEAVKLGAIASAAGVPLNVSHKED